MLVRKLQKLYSLFIVINFCCSVCFLTVGGNSACLSFLRVSYFLCKSKTQVSYRNVSYKKKKVYVS